mmetsp:Transcript_39315/g.117583  ORF Transcript_39315/g.117583 Transcript_39315/m.117583 type:complete len:237 (+) Transcript_39315:385-1095(+)
MLHHVLDGAHEKLRAHGDHQRDDRHQTDGARGRQAGALLILVVVDCLPVILGEHCLVGDELENHEGAIAQANDHRTNARDAQQPLFLVRLVIAFVANGRKDCGQRQGHASQQLQPHADQRALDGEELLLLGHNNPRAPVVILLVDDVVGSVCCGTRGEAAKEERRAQHQQQVGEDRAEEGGPDNAQQALPQGLHRQDHLHGVAKRGIQQAAQRVVVDGCCKLLCGIAKEFGQGDNA